MSGMWKILFIKSSFKAVIILGREFYKIGRVWVKHGSSTVVTFIILASF
jgi:hypothetical protein